jgi:hypothetical protein
MVRPPNIVGIEERYQRTSRFIDSDVPCLGHTGMGLLDVRKAGIVQAFYDFGPAVF